MHVEHRVSSMDSEQGQRLQKMKWANIIQKKKRRTFGGRGRVLFRTRGWWRPTIEIWQGETRGNFWVYNDNVACELCKC